MHDPTLKWLLMKFKSSQYLKSCVSAKFLHLFHYGDVLYAAASSRGLQSLNTVCQYALRFVAGCGHLTRHCILYAKFGFPSLNVCWNTHWLTFSYKSLLGFRIYHFISKELKLHSGDILQLIVPLACTELGKRAFSFVALSAWNTHQKDVKLSGWISLEAFILGRW